MQQSKVRVSARAICRTQGEIQCVTLVVRFLAEQLQYPRVKVNVTSKVRSRPRLETMKTLENPYNTQNRLWCYWLNDLFAQRRAIRTDTALILLEMMEFPSYVGRQKRKIQRAQSIHSHQSLDLQVLT